MLSFLRRTPCSSQDDLAFLRRARSSRPSGPSASTGGTSTARRFVSTGAVHKNPQGSVPTRTPGISVTPSAAVVAYFNKSSATVFHEKLELFETANKGLGVRATDDILKGEVVLVDRALFSVSTVPPMERPSTRDHDRRRGGSFLSQRITTTFESLSQEDQEQYLSLAGDHDDPHPISTVHKMNLLQTHRDQDDLPRRLMRIFRANPFEQDQRVSVFVRATRMNHSCAANCHMRIGDGDAAGEQEEHGAPATGRTVEQPAGAPGDVAREPPTLRMIASRNCRKGEELTFNYKQGAREGFWFLGARERGDALLRDAGFRCRCVVCATNHTSTSEAGFAKRGSDATTQRTSDRRRKELSTLWQGLREHLLLGVNTYRATLFAESAETDAVGSSVGLEVVSSSVGSTSFEQPAEPSVDSALFFRALVYDQGDFEEVRRRISTLLREEFDTQLPDLDARLCFVGALHYCGLCWTANTTLLDRRAGASSGEEQGADDWEMEDGGAEGGRAGTRDHTGADGKTSSPFEHLDSREVVGLRKQFAQRCLGFLRLQHKFNACFDGEGSGLAVANRYELQWAMPNFLPILYSISIFYLLWCLCHSLLLVISALHDHVLFLWCISVSVDVSTTSQ